MRSGVGDATGHKTRRNKSNGKEEAAVSRGAFNDSLDFRYRIAIAEETRGGCGKRDQESTAAPSKPLLRAVCSFTSRNIVRGKREEEE